MVLRAVLLLWQDEKSRRETLFDIVIRGRGTWAAARSPAWPKGQANKIEFFSSRSSVKHGKSNVRPKGRVLDLVMNDEQRVLLSLTDQLESLILAQNERWRQA